MFSLTFLGHQGWLIATPNTAILLDPLLTDGFGHGGLLGEVYPPRTIDLGACPPLDAVVISHEHDDHFDLPSLARLDRRTPILLSSRASIAAREVLATMGFRVRPLPPDARLEIGDLRLHTFLTDHRGGRQADEWDGVPMLIGDRHGHGSLWTSIDVAPRDVDLARLGALARPGFWAQANNSSRAGFQDALAQASASIDDDDAPLLARVFARRHAALAERWGPPRATLICGAGWSLPGERAWMNHHLFPIDGERVAEALASMIEAGPVIAPVPGQTAISRDGELETLDARSSFVRARPRASWPARDHRGPGPRLRDYAPASGRRRLDPERRAQLIDELDDFARSLYAGELFCALHSLPPVVEGREAALCLHLLDEGGALVLAHDPTAARFRVDDSGRDPLATFVCGLECWAADLLALLRGELAASALCYAGRMRHWNHAPDRVRASPQLLWTYANPLRRPDRAARLYARLLADYKLTSTSKTP